MLNRDIDRVVLGEDGKVIGVEADGIMAKTNLVIGDPSYFPDRVRKVQKVIRAIAIMDHPLPETNGSPSCQVIFPQGQVSCSFPNKPGLLSDLFLFMVPLRSTARTMSTCFRSVPTTKSAPRSVTLRARRPPLRVKFRRA